MTSQVASSLNGSVNFAEVRLMLVSTVVLPESFSATHFADPTYHLNMEVFLRGIHTNGLILIDADEQLYQKICDNVDRLANYGKGKTTHALFEELLKKHREKIIRFVKTQCTFNRKCQLSDVAAGVATTCKVDSLLTDPDSQPQLATATGGSVPVIAISDYIHSNIEAERRRYVESLPSLDQMATGEFDQLIIRATRFSRWLRFYDKQIGKGASLSRFQRGIERILELWITNAHFARSELSAELYTVVDESPDKQFDPSVAYHRVKKYLVEPLHHHFGIPITLSVKRDPDSKCHPRHLQTQSLAIMFERGFDILDDNGALCRTFMTLGGDYTPHLQEFRRLQEYIPPRTP